VESVRDRDKGAVASLQPLSRCNRPFTAEVGAMHPHPNLLVCKYMYTPHVCAWLPRVLSLLVPSSVCVGVREGEKKKEWHSEERDIAHTSDSKTSVALDERKKEPEWVRK